MIRFVLAALFSALLLACSGDDDESPPQASSPEATAATPRVVNGTVVPNMTPEPTPTGDTTALLDLTEVFSEPQPVEGAPVELTERPESAFAAWDGASVVLYDTEAQESHNLGPGNLFTPAFSDSHFVYVSGYEVWLVDLQTLERRSLGPGTVAYFLGDEYVVVNPGDNAFVAVNIATGIRTPLGELTNPFLKSMVQQRSGGSFKAFWVTGIYEVRLAQSVEDACQETGSQRRACEARASQEWQVWNVWTDQLQMEFTAARVAPAAGREIVIATPPVCEGSNGLSVPCHDLLARMDSPSTGAADPVHVEGTTNIFVVNVETAETQFVATATYNAATTPWPMRWPLAANRDYVVWTESYCGDPAGQTRIFERETREVRELPVSEWVSLRGGRLGMGEKGADAVLDVETLEYLSVLPVRGEVSWSRDYKYAAVGQAFADTTTCE